MPTVTLNKFDKGMVNDPRTPASDVCRVCTNFDALTDPYRLTPYRNGETGNTNQNTDKIKNYQIALRTGSTYSLYGLGVASGTSKAKIFYKDITTGSANDLDDADWAETSNNAQSTGTASATDLFIYYKRTGFIYGARDGTKLWKYDPSGSTAWDDSYQDLSYTFVAQGLVHSIDDILYIPYDNKIARLNNTSWNSAALTLPSHLRVRSICEYGNYLAIACEPVSGSTPGFGGSIVYLWDRDSSLETLSDSISWGDERLLVLEEINGTLVGISIATGSTRFNSRVIFRYLSVSSAIKFAEFTATTGTDLQSYKQKINNRLYFLLEITLNGSSRHGVWSVGGTPGNFSVFHERTTSNDTSFTDLELFAFHFVGDYLFTSYADTVSATTTNYMSKTNDTETYTATSIYETTINPNMPLTDRQQVKQLESVGAKYESMGTGGQIVVKYKVDDGSYITVFTESTDNVVYTEPYPATSSGENFTSGKNYEFRIESTGGVKLTELTYKYSVKPSNV